MITRRQLLAFGAAAAVSRRVLADGTRPMPCGFVGHGSPMLAIDPVRGAELRAWGASLPRPAGIIAMTPHYRSRGLKIGHVGKGRALYSFPDFMRDRIPRDLDYASPDNAALAHTVADLLAPLEPTFDESRAGFDHTTWMPLRHMFPDASAPVVEIAMPFMQEKELMTLGRRLAPLRHQNVFILASGSITHNLASMGTAQGAWAPAFDDWAEQTLHARDDAALLDWRKKAPNAELAHPDDGGHFRVLLVAYGASSGPVSFPARGFEKDPNRSVASNWRENLVPCVTMDRDSTAPVEIGRYVLYDRIASGGMAAVYLGRLAGPVGFARTVAIKRLHPQFAADTEFVGMFLDEARLAARIQHPNVVPTLDVVATGGELFLVMEYVRGESASQLVRRTAARMEHIPENVVAAIISGVLQGLHAAHEAHDESGVALEIVHRDVSPQNIIVGVDGTPRVLDFGVAKAEGKFHSTRGGEIKGKVLYMSPEQLEGEAVDRTTDVYAMGLVLFEMLTGKRMFQKTQDMTSLGRILRNELALPSSVDPNLAKWDDIVRKASGPRAERYPTARAMAIDVERACQIASSVEVADWVEHNSGPEVRERAKRIAEIESGRARVDRHELEAALKNELAGEGSARSERTAGSQVSHAIDPADVDFRPKSRARMLVPLGLVAAVTIGGAIFYAQRDTTAATATPPPPTTTTAAPTPTPTETAANNIVVRPPTTTAEDPPPPPSATASAKAKTGTKTVVKTTTQVAKPNCDTPYTIDAEGHKHFRTEVSVKRAAFAFFTCSFFGTLATSAHADERASCVQAADRGQVARDQGRLSAARVEFTDCARASCPKLVTQQCTEWLASIAQDMPTVSFRALDPNGTEILDVTVYVDSTERKGSLDGVPLEIDPGVHTFRLVHAGSPDVLFQSIIRVKEKNRVLEAKFKVGEAEKPPEHHHPFRFPWTASLSFIVGIGSFAGMGVLIGTAAHDTDAMRQSCAGSCLKADVDWVNTRVLLANVAMGVGIAGISLFALSLIVANVGSSKDDPKVSLMVGPGSVGFAGRF